MLVLVVAGRSLLGLFGSDYADHGATLLLLLAACGIPDAVTNLAVAVMRVTGQLPSAARLALGMAAATLGGTWVLLPAAGLAAPGIAFLSAQVAGSVWVLARLRRRRVSLWAGPAPAVQLSRGR
jgi:O-antigen/teichoic acid export membrane protein